MRQLVMLSCDSWQACKTIYHKACALELDPEGLTGGGKIKIEGQAFDEEAPEKKPKMKVTLRRNAMKKSSKVLVLRHFSKFLF